MKKTKEINTLKKLKDERENLLSQIDDIEKNIFEIEANIAWDLVVNDGELYSVFDESEIAQYKELTTSVHDALGQKKIAVKLIEQNL